MSIKFKPLHDRILVSRLEEEAKSAGGILIPDNAKEKPIQGTVVAVGSGKALDNGEIRPLEVQVGQTVLFGKYAGTDVKIDGKEYVVMREEDILGIMG